MTVIADKYKGMLGREYALAVIRDEWAVLLQAIHEAMESVRN